MKKIFDDIRPYYDSEIPEAMKRIADSPMLSLVASYVYPNKQLSEIKEMLCGFKTTRDFQHGVMYDVNKQIISKSITQFTYGGTEQLKKSEAYLYVSNHRDIMLDASILQNVLVDEGLESSQITFGANLMMNPLVVDIGKSNKMFRVERLGNSTKEFYKSSLHLSEYIRSVITEELVPVSVSYEWESCDILKAIELYESSKVKYIKKPGEDLNSILTGILQPKGRVHFQLCPIIKKEELQQFDNCTNNEYHKNVAKLIDTRILKAYKLWPNNFIAYDMLYGQQRFKSEYTEAEKITFEKHLCKLDCYEDCLDNLKDILLGIYANPVRNSMK